MALAGLAALVTVLELVFAQHYQEPVMFIPFGLVALTLLALTTVALRPTTRFLRLFQGVMALLFVGSVLGVFFHLQGNLEVVQEVNPDLSGFALVWKVLTGAAPAFAPALLAFVGLLGLLFTYRHPGLVAEETRAFTPFESSLES